MIPILFSPDEPLYNHDRSTLSNGLGRLKDCLECYADSGINDEETLTFVYPMTGELFPLLQDRSIVVAYNSRLKKLQPYRIYEYDQPIDGLVTFYAEHISYDLLGIPVYPYTAVDVGTALAKLKSHSAIENPFNFSTDKTTAVAFQRKFPTNARQLLSGVEGSILDTYRGEYEFDWYDVILHNRRGSDRGFRITYGKNMTDYEQERNCSDCYTGAIGYYYSQEEDISIYTDVVSAGDNYNYQKIATIDLSDQFQETPTQEELLAVLQNRMASSSFGVPKVSWKLKFVDLSQASGLVDQDLFTTVDLGDTVHVRFEKMGVTATARVNHTRWNVLLDRYEEIDLGSIRSSITDTILSQDEALSQTIDAVQVESIAARITSSLTKILFGLDGGVIRFLDTNEDGELDTLYIADDPNPETAIKVWRFNYLGFAASKNGYNGPFEFGATLDDGLLANFVTAAKLVAGTIQSADGTTFYLNLDEGILQMGNYYSKDETDAEIGRFVRIQDGKIYIGLEGNNIQLVESNDKVAFVDKGTNTEVAYISNDRFYTPNLTVLETADFGGYRMNVSNGIAFKWVGRD